MGGICRLTFGGLPAGHERRDRQRLVSSHQRADVKLTAVYMKVPEGYIAFVEELPGANTQGETLEEARANLEEAVTMVLVANREMSEQALVGANVIRESFFLPAA
jgi:predicted RNase H-like HicB family nuclease